ncbi:hypothetical protein RND81_07G101000 [Saponaria officinalis]|uniref:Myb/SANT-like DNA-binding domain-containing protein n=2 Tax=Saponaria officinalis TaxID=3572 RepID=A0AAW1JQA4_SAPOF
MDRRTSFPYPLRSKPYPNFSGYEDDDDDDAVLGSVNDSDDSGNNDVGDDNDEDYRGHRFRHGIPTRHPRKQRKLSSLNYHFTPPSAATSAWSEEGTFVLLEIWGERFLQLGRSSLRSEDWKDVAERVSQATRSEIEVSECRNRMNVLKAKYKREKAKWGGLGGGISKWVFYRKMDGLMTMSPRQLQQQEQCGLACGVDSGEFVFMNPRVYLEHSNALDEMRDSPGNSESEGSDEGEDGEDEEEDEGEADESYRLLSESIQRVGEIYEKIEDSKRHHMMELERMRAEFQRDLEMQKKEMVDRTTAEIEKLSDRGDRGSNCSVQNAGGE